ncbi:MAG: class I SAM-dependent methyltransferase, partial [Chloroflexi bacterium]|nr:class I SAM-dependent methyltransferase [Chloroflexota bacterium]
MTEQDPGWVRAHSDDEDDWVRWAQSPVQQIDFAIHIHYLQQWLKGQERVLEVGAGAGRFTRELAALVRRIVVVDLSEEKLRRNRRNAEAIGYLDAIEAWCHCDMVNLSQSFAVNEFDAVVCYGGPLSYVFDRRWKAIQELVRVTKPGG